MSYDVTPDTHRPLPAGFLLQQAIGKHAQAFAADRDHFDGEKRRAIRTAIRVAFLGEFESDAANAKPSLWVFVTQASPALHAVTPLWRGRGPLGYFHAGYLPAKDNAEVTSIVQDCIARGGYDEAEWREFVSRSIA